MKEDTNAQPKKSRLTTVVIIILLAGLALWGAYETGLLDGLLNLLPIPKKQIQEDMYWGKPNKVRVNFTWFRSKVKRVNPKTNIDETQTFVKGTVYNLTNKPLKVSSITLALLSANDIWLHELLHRTTLNIQAHQNESFDFSDWVPTGLLGDVKKLSGRLGYTLADN